LRDFGEQVVQAPGDLTEEKVREECTRLFWADFPRRNTFTEAFFKDAVNYAIRKLKSRYQ
jgi:hypothetical protein